jgi:DNA-binding transcriptional regulator LsrR (DeoR family)
LAGGQSKTAAIRGALRTGVIDLLITDKFTAARLDDLGSQPAAAE